MVRGFQPRIRLSTVSTEPTSDSLSTSLSASSPLTLSLPKINIFKTFLGRVGKSAMSTTATPVQRLEFVGGWFGPLYIVLFNFFFKCFYLFLRQRETEHEQGRGRERGRHRIQSRIQARSCQHRAWHGAQTHRVWDHGLNWRRMLNRQSHPGTPHSIVLKQDLVMGSRSSLWKYNIVINISVTLREKYRNKK